jgi:hypothetical protein
MRCETVQDLLIDGGEADGSLRRAAMEHLSDCPSCGDAQYAVAALHGSRLQRIPPPTPGAMQRAIAAAVRAPTAGRDGARRGGARGGRPASSRPGFWSGTAVGGSIAAALAVAWVMGSTPRQQIQPPAETPEVTLALNETREISIAVDTPMALDDAEIHIELTGAIGLSGFADQRELRWRANLEAGSNQLTLPVVALGPRGGQVLVEVLHRDKRRKFVVDVRSFEA